MKLAEFTGKTPGEAVIEALREWVEKERAAKKEQERVIKLLRELVSSLPVLDPRTPDELIGYDEIGVPR